EARANRRVLRRRTGRPRDADARSKIQIAVDVVLVLVTHAIAEREIRPVTPIILREPAKIELTDGRSRVAGVYRELSSAAALEANLCAAQALRDALLGNLIGLNTCQSFGIREIASAGEYPGAAEIIR